MKSLYLSVLAVVLAALSAPAWVHHSGAMFDRSKEMKITGTVTEFQWTNPHASFKVDVLGADGKTLGGAGEPSGGEPPAAPAPDHG
jgi:hypothetical protein